MPIDQVISMKVDLTFSTMSLIQNFFLCIPLANLPSLCFSIMCLFPYFRIEFFISSGMLSCVWSRMRSKCLYSELLRSSRFTTVLWDRSIDQRMEFWMICSLVFSLCLSERIWEFFPPSSIQALPVDVLPPRAKCFYFDLLSKFLPFDDYGKEYFYFVQLNGRWDFRGETNALECSIFAPLSEL